LVLLAVGRTIRNTVRAHPKRGPIGCELELVGLVLVVVNGLALLLLGLASLTTHASDATTTYFVGVLAGAAVGYFSKEIFQPDRIGFLVRHSFPPHHERVVHTVLLPTVQLANNRPAGIQRAWSRMPWPPTTTTTRT